MPEFSSSAIAAAQKFRLIMTAMSQPGRTMVLPSAIAHVEALSSASLTILTTLCDYQTPIFLSAGIASPNVEQRVRFETGAPITSKPEDAAFAVLMAEELGGVMPRFARGTHEYPDRSTCLIVQLPASGPGAAVELRGPGLAHPLELSLPGIGSDIWRNRAEVNSDFPLGLDFIFVSGHALTACPRSTAARLVEMA